MPLTSQPCISLSKINHQILSLLSQLIDLAITHGYVSHVQLCAAPLNCSPPGSSVHEILQARVLEWVVMPSSREYSHPGIEPTSLMSHVPLAPPGKCSERYICVCVCVCVCVCISTYTYTYIHVCGCVCVCFFLYIFFFRFFSLIGYYKILSVALCALQW